MRSGFYADDMSNSLSWTALLEEGPSRYEMLVHGSPSGPVPGRYYPLSNYAYFLFDLVHGNAFVYKFIISLCVMISILLFALLIIEVFKRKEIAATSILILPLFMQFRIFYDPITSFHAFMQILLIFLVLTLISLNRFLEKHKKYYLVLSLITFTCTIFLYEISYLFIFFVLFLILRSKIGFQKKLFYTFLYCIPLIFAILLSIRERSRYESMPSYKINFTLVEYVPALLRQIYAAFPLSYYKSNPGNMFSHNMQTVLDRVTLDDLITVSLFIIIAVLLLIKTKWISHKIEIPKNERKINVKSRNINKRFSAKNTNLISVKQRIDKDLLVFGIMLLAIPNILIALSPTYQYLIYWGVAHIPVYISYFGAFLIICTCIDTILKKLKGYLKIGLIGLLIVAISSGYLVNLQNNRQVIETQNQTYWYKRNFLESMQKESNFMNRVPENSLVLYSVEDNLSLDVQPFLFSLTGRTIENIDTRRLLPWYLEMREIDFRERYKLGNPVYWNKFGSSEKDLFNKYEKIFILKYWSNSFTKGYISLSEITDLTLDSEDKATFVKIRDARLYTYNAKQKILGVNLKAYSCERVSLVCSSDLVRLRLTPRVEPLIRGNYLEYEIMPKIGEFNPLQWIDFKSIQVIGMDNPMGGPET